MDFVKNLNFNSVTLAYLLFLAVILIAFTGPDQKKPTQLLILEFNSYEQMKDQSESLFKKGWQVKDFEPYHDNSNSHSDFIVIYEK